MCSHWTLKAPWMVLLTMDLPLCSRPKLQVTIPHPTRYHQIFSYSYGCFQIIHFNRVFHHKPSIFGYPYFWKHPYNTCHHAFHTFPESSTRQLFCVFFSPPPDSSARNRRCWLKCQRSCSVTSMKSREVQISANPLSGMSSRTLRTSLDTSTVGSLLLCESGKTCQDSPIRSNDPNPKYV